MMNESDPYPQIMFENVGGSFHRNDIVHNELTVGGQIVSLLVQLFDSGLVLAVCKCDRFAIVNKTK